MSLTTRVCFYIAVPLRAMNSTNALIKAHKNMHTFAEVFFEKTRLKNNLSIHHYGNGSVPNSVVFDICAAARRMKETRV